MSAPLPARRRPARGVFRARPRARSDRAEDLRPLVRFLSRPDREKAIESLFAWHTGAFVRYGRLQPHLQILPELGYLEVARNRHARRQRIATGPCPRSTTNRMSVGCVHLQRPGDLLRV